MSASKPHPEPKRAAPLVLWRALRAFLATMFTLFGEPQELAAEALMRRKQRALMLPWLRAGEAFLRRLLFIEALALALVDAAPALAASQRAPRLPRMRKAVGFFPDKPDDWRVSFRVFEPTRNHRAHGRTRRTREPLLLGPLLRPPRQPHVFAIDRPIGSAPSRTMLEPRNWLNSWPAAERLEAILRVYNDPHPCARRLARALRRNADCADRVLKPQPPCVAIVFGDYFAPCDRIAEKHRRSWSQPPQPPDTG